MLLLFSFSGIDVNGSKRLSPIPSVSNLSLATSDSLSVQRGLEAREQMERRTIVCYLGGIWKRLEPLERIYDRFPSVDPSGSFAGIPNLGKPLYKENTVYSITHKNRPMDHPGET